MSHTVCLVLMPDCRSSAESSAASGPSNGVRFSFVARSRVTCLTSTSRATYVNSTVCSMLCHTLSCVNRQRSTVPRAPHTACAPRRARAHERRAASRLQRDARERDLAVSHIHPSSSRPSPDAAASRHLSRARGRSRETICALAADGSISPPCACAAAGAVSCCARSAG